MTVFNSDLLTSAKGARPIAMHGERGNVQHVQCTVTCAAAPATTDTINFFDLPANARIISMRCVPSDMDTNGSPLLALNIGDSGSAARYFSALLAGIATVSTDMTLASGIGYLTTAKTRIVGVASTNAATGAAGTIYLSCTYVVEDPATT